jgi:serine/threonine-protein kinase
VPEVLVPDLRGRPEQEARRLLDEENLIPVNGGVPRYDNTIPPGAVVEQQVPPDSQIEQGQRVTYTLSLGPELVDVPNLERIRVSEALAEAERVGLLVEIVEEPSLTIPEGFVIRQEPKNVRVRAGDTILLAVSIGDKIPFPSVIGLLRSEAEQLLVNSGLELELVDEQGRDHLGIRFDQFRPNEVISAQANGRPVQNTEYIPRGSSIILGVRAP